MPSGFNRHDYLELLRISDAKGNSRLFGLWRIVSGAKCRDKRVQRRLRKAYPKAYKVLMMPLEEVALHISHPNPGAALIAEWRMKLGR